MIKDLVILAQNTLAQEKEEASQLRIAAKLPPGFDERKKRREQMLELGMQAYEELRQISSSEQAAKEAKCRMQAYLAMARVGSFNAAIINDQETEDLTKLIEEVEEKSQQLDEAIEKWNKRQREIEEEQGAG
jgi:hypothetical protein